MKHLQILRLLYSKMRSSISDSGIGMICNVFPNTLSRLLLAFCPNITSSGIQFATAQLPLLELMDCGMNVCDSNAQDLPSEDNSDCELQKITNNKLHLMYQKLIIKYGRLKKLSLWGCSGLDVWDDMCASKNSFPFKCLADGSKRVRVPHYLNQQVSRHQGDAPFFFTYSAGLETLQLSLT